MHIITRAISELVISLKLSYLRLCPALNQTYHALVLIGVKLNVDTTEGVYW